MEPQKLCEHLVETTPAARAWAYAPDERGAFRLVGQAGRFRVTEDLEHPRSRRDLDAAWASGETRERALPEGGRSAVVGLTIRAPLPDGDVLVRLDRDRGEASFTEGEIREVEAAIDRVT